MSNLEVIIEKAILKDLDEIQKVIKEAFKKYQDLEIDKDINPFYLTKERLKFNISYLEGEFLLAKIDSRIVGGLFYYYVDYLNKRIHVDQIFVLPKEQKQGIGTKLINILKNDEKVKEIYLDVIDFDKDNLNFYLHQGFNIDEYIVENEKEKYYLLCYKK